MASCSCGTHTGHFACVCPAGYYGRGLVGDCTRRLFYAYYLCLITAFEITLSSFRFLNLSILDNFYRISLHRMLRVCNFVIETDV